ncbi:MAG: cytochrome-c oxidase, cbb3-type subunit III [Micropepsaceae bacterium]
MSARKEVDEFSGTETTGHEWDGIRELNTPLPRWWLWVFYATIVWSIGYWVLYPSWPTPTGYLPGVLHQSQRADVDQAVQALKAKRADMGKQLAGSTLQQIEADPNLFQFAREAGKSTFGDNCSTCHGSGAQGNKGYPNLNDDVWLWGGTLDDIKQTITVGVRSTHPDTRQSLMPAFGTDGILPAKQIDDLTEYVVHLSGGKADPQSVQRATQLWVDNCAACHADDGKGKREFGSPNLTDKDWLYGGTKADIRSQIVNGKGGVMPTWGSRLDPMTIDALAVYVHSLGGGE